MTIYTDEELAIAKSVDLVAVANALGYQTKRVGSYHTIKEMDSIRIYNRKTWYRWSRQYESEGRDGTQIDFLMTFGNEKVDIFFTDICCFHKIFPLCKHEFIL